MLNLTGQVPQRKIVLANRVRPARNFWTKIFHFAHLLCSLESGLFGGGARRGIFPEQRLVIEPTYLPAVVVFTKIPPSDFLSDPALCLIM